MEDQLISFETAKLAKEKGFSNKVLYYYDDDKEKKINLNKYGPITKNSNTGVNSTSAPTQSSLQKWLREVHKIHIMVESFNDDTYWATLVYDFHSGEETEGDVEDNSYEETLEKALNFALTKI